MKAIKVLLALGLLSGAANAATITVSSGLPAQGFNIFVDGVAAPEFYVSVGTWDATTNLFSVFGNPVLDTGKLNASVTATGPASFNGQIIAVMASIAPTQIGSGNGWVVMTHNNNTSFPADVSVATGVTFAATLPTVVTIVGKGFESSGFFDPATGVPGSTQNLNIVTIPEPTTALLGLIGALGLLRRRR